MKLIAFIFVAVFCTVHGGVINTDTMQRLEKFNETIHNYIKTSDTNLNEFKTRLHSIDSLFDEDGKKVYREVLDPLMTFIDTETVKWNKEMIHLYDEVHHVMTVWMQDVDDFEKSIAHEKFTGLDTTANMKNLRTCMNTVEEATVSFVDRMLVDDMKEVKKANGVIDQFKSCVNDESKTTPDCMKILKVWADEQEEGWDYTPEDALNVALMARGSCVVDEVEAIKNNFKSNDVDFKKFIGKYCEDLTVICYFFTKH